LFRPQFLDPDYSSTRNGAMTKIFANRSTVAACVLLGLLFTAVFAVGASRFLGPVGWPAFIGLVFAAIAIPMVFVVPVHWLPAIALGMFILVPNRITPDGYTLRIPLWGFLIAIWVFRRLLLRSREVGQRENDASRTLVLGWRVLAYVGALVFFLWAAFASLRSDEVQTGFAWLGSIVVCVFLPLLVLDARREAELLRSVWIIGGAIVGAYAVVELLIQSSPIYGTIYRAIGVDDVQHWVLHRSEGSFGHPLLAGTFFSVAAVLGIVAWLSSRRPRDLICGGIAAAAVVATVSRSSMLALGAAIIFALVVWVLMNPDRPIGKPAFFGVVGAIAAIAVLNSTPVTARTDSLESVRSAGARETAIGVALRGAEATGWLGSGPGTSGITGRLFDEVTIENSGLQLLLSVGIPGLLFFSVFLGGVALTALSARDIAAASALLAFGICMVGYNAIDAVRATHLLMGFLVIICLNPITQKPLADTAAHVRRSTTTSRGEAVGAAKSGILP
jgi:polysaccharide biosynthesis protein PslJ